MKVRHLGVGLLLAGLALSGCSSTPSESSPSDSALSTPAASLFASASPSASPASTQPPQIRLKSIVQLNDPVDPSACATPAPAGSPVGAGTTVTLSNGAGVVLATGTLRVPGIGEFFGPEGNTFDGWGDLEELNGGPVTNACFYVADFGTVAPAATYILSMDGAPDIQTDQTQLDANEGWIHQII